MKHANPTGSQPATRPGVDAGIAAARVRSAGRAISWLAGLAVLLFSAASANADGLEVTVLTQAPTNPVPRTAQTITYRIQTANFAAGGEPTTIGVGIDIQLNGVSVAANSGRFATSPDQCIVDPQFPNLWACNDLQEGGAQTISFTWNTPDPGTNTIAFRGLCQVIPPPPGGFQPCTTANTAAVTTTVENLAPNGTIQEPEGDITINAGVAVNFSGTGSDGDGDPVSFLWDFDGAAQDSTLPNPEPVIFTNAGVFDVTLTVTDSFGEPDPTPDSRTITVLGAPTASLSASPDTIPLGGSSTLTWGSTSATSCTGTGFNTGGATSGTVIVSPSVTTAFSVTCANASGATSAPATVTVTVGAAIVATLSAAPPLIPLGGSSTLTWGSSQNATSCAGSGFNTGGAASGSVDVSPNATTTFSVICSGAAGATSPPTSATVTVGAGVTASLSAAPSAIPQGGSSTLTWASANATSCTGTGFNTGGAASGSLDVSPNATTTFSVICSGAAGATSPPTSATVTVGAGVTASLSAAPSPIPQGGSSTLTWASANATSCTGTGFNTGGAASGSLDVSPNATTTFSVICSGAAGATSPPTSATVTVGAGVTASLSAAPSPIPQGGSSTLTWASANATSCTGTGFNTGGAASGSVDVSPNATTTFSVICSGAAGATSPPTSATVTVGAGVTASLSAAPSAIPQGGSSTLTWASANATSCTGTGFNTGGAASGSVDVSPNATTTFSVTCSGAAGATSPPAVATVTVGAAVAASLVASPLAIPLGGSSTLTWDSASATSCVGAGFNTGGATSGSVDVSPNETTDFSVTCSGAGGATSAPAVATVTVGAGVAASLSASPLAIPLGGSSTLTWDSANATSCTGSGFGTEGETSGSVDVSPDATTTFEVTCIGEGGATSDPAAATVTVGAGVTASLSASPDTIPSGGSATLTWDSTNASSCEGTGFDTDDETSGSVDVSPEETSSFSVTCLGVGGGSSAPATATVTVTDEPSCGDEVVDPGEECDDGNTRNGDGCSAVCTNEELVEFDDWAEDLEFFGDHILVAAQSAGLQLVEFNQGLFGDVRAFNPSRCDGSGSPEFFVEDVEVSEAGQAYMALGPCGVGILSVDELIDSDDDPEMTLVPIEGWVEDVHVVGGMAYVAAFEGGLVMVDVTSPGTIEVVGTAGFASPGGFGAAIDVEVLGDIAYVATTRGLRVVDVSEPSSPKVIGRFATDPDSAPAQDVAVADFEGRTVAFLSIWESGLELIDVTDPSAPFAMLEEPVSSRDASLEVLVAGSTVFLADARQGLRTFAVLPEAPFVDEARRFPTPGVTWDVELRDGFAVVAFGQNPDGNQSGGLVSVDVSALALTATDVSAATRMDAAGPVTCGRFCALVDGALEWKIKGIDVAGAHDWELDLALDDDGRWIGQDADGNVFSGSYEKKKRRGARKKFVLRFNSDSKSRLLEVLEDLATAETGQDMGLTYRDDPKLKLSRHKKKVKLKGAVKIDAVGDEGASNSGEFEVRRATGPLR